MTSLQLHFDPQQEALLIPKQTSLSRQTSSTASTTLAEGSKLKRLKADTVSSNSDQFPEGMLSRGADSHGLFYLDWEAECGFDWDVLDESLQSLLTPVVFQHIAWFWECSMLPAQQSACLPGTRSLSASRGRTLGKGKTVTTWQYIHVYMCDTPATAS